MMDKCNRGGVASKDEASLADWGVVIEYYGVPCACRCQHCALSAGSRVSSVSYACAKMVAQRFMDWAHSRPETGPRVEFTVGFSYEMEISQLRDYIRFRRLYKMPGWDYLPLNGLRLREDGELERLLSSLAAVGVRLVNLSFYGVAEAHDQWAKRPGDFQYLMRIAQALGECGLSRCETIFPRKTVIRELPRLVEMLDRLPGLEQRIIAPWDFRGRGRDVEEERPELQDLSLLPLHVRRMVNLNRYRTEAAWIQAVISGDIAPRTKRIYLLCVSDNNIHYLERHECGAILSDLRLREEARRRDEPSLVELANEFGDRDNLRLHALRDLEWKWLGQYYRSSHRALPDYLKPVGSKMVLR